MILGLDLLAAPQYPGIAMKFKGYAIRSFATTFGDFYPLAEKLLEEGLQYLGVDLLWSDTHSFGDKDIPQVKKLAAKYENLAKKYPMRHVELNVFVEHNLTNPDKYLDIAQLAAPSCTIVNNPWKGVFSKRYKNEVHGDKNPPAGRYNYSVDGGFKDHTDVMDCDVVGLIDKHKNAEIFYMWSARFNLNYSLKDSTPRAKRIAEAKQRSPSPDYIQSNLYLFSDKGAYDLPPGWLVKSHAERHDAADKKGDKLLVICPKKVDSVVLKKGDKVIGKLPYYGPFDGGGFRFYGNTFGYKYGANVEVWIENKRYGTINCGFRSKPFRA